MEQNLNTEVIEMAQEAVEVTPEVVEQAAGMGFGTKFLLAGLVVAGAAGIYVGYKKYKEHKAKNYAKGKPGEEPIDTTGEELPDEETDK